LLSEKPLGERSLTDFCLTVQFESIRTALSHYTISGAMGHLLDARQDGLSASRFVVFEMSELMNMGEKNLIPVLLYLFRWFETSLHGQPGLLLLDEAWTMLSHALFREKIKTWLKEMRKNNVGVVLATQSLSDALNSGIFDVIKESCPTKIFLPNAEIESQPGPIYQIYHQMGLNDAQINLIKHATPKRHYYYHSPLGNRLFDLGLGPLALAFLAVSDKQTLAHLRELSTQFGEQWPYAWLEEKGVDYARYQTHR
jgi:type IV secretory pathway VirB4 component